jgi:hypothetical protein
MHAQQVAHAGGVLCAELRHHASLFRRQRERATFRDVVRERFLAIDIFFRRE